MNIVARVVSDAQVRTLPSNKQVAKFSVVTNETYKKKNGEVVNNATFFDCSYWLRPNAASFLTKGTIVELTGTVSARAWIGKDGELRAGLDLNVSHIHPHGGGKRADRQPPKNTSPEPQEIIEDDLPF